MKLLKKLLNNDYSISIIKKFIMIFLGLITSALTVRTLGLYLKGQQAYILNIENMLMLIFNFGVHNAYSVMRKQGYDLQKLKRKYFDFCFMLFIIYLIISIVSFILFPNDLLPLVFILTTFNIYAGQLGNILMIEDFKAHSILYTLNTVFNLGIVFVVYVCFPKNLIAVLLTYLATSTFIIIGCMWKLEVFPKLTRGSIKFSKKLIVLGFYPMLIGLLNVMNYNFDTIMLKNMAVPYDLIGLYSIGTALAGYLWLLPDIFKDISFSRSAKGDSIDSVCFSLRLSNTITLLLMIVIVVFGKVIIYILYGLEYVPAYEVTIFILMGVPALGIFKIVSPVYIANSRSKYVFYVLLLSVISNIILNYLMIPYFSINGAAIASLISYGLCGIVILENFKHRYRKKMRDLFLVNLNDVRKIGKFIMNDER